MTRKSVVAAIVATMVVALGLGAAWMWRIRQAPGHANTPAGAPALSAPATAVDPTRAPVAIDARRQQLIGVRTVKATRSNLGQVIRTVGAVRYDETRVVDANIKLDGWIRDLAADYTGRFVERGAPLLTLYSPDLLAAEREYVLALAARDEMSASILTETKTRADALVSAARERLVRMDVSAGELRDLDDSRQPRDAVVLTSPASGVVIEKQAVKGAYVTSGQTLYRIADLSVVWVEADVYEQDVPFVHVGDRATVTLDAYPGETESGRVTYVYPFLDPQTRTNKVRYEFPNSRGRLKPGMYATVELTTRSMTGIILPADAVLDSGREQLVFIAEGNGRFVPRSVTIGRRVGENVQIATGVDEGEEVATAAAFFLDSESQLRGAVQSYAPPAAASSPASPSASDQIQIALRTMPDPARTGENQFEARVADSQGKPITDADVTVHLFMPAMPTMNMPAMQNDVTLSAVSAGVYRGTGQVLMAGRWDLTVSVSRAGKTLGSRQQPLVAR
jgi:Cu(I)/Ag(I) efflux system membrane fusion protein